MLPLEFATKASLSAKETMTPPTRKALSQSESTIQPGASPVGPLPVFFLRHGEAGQRSAWAGKDAERPLTNEGRKTG